MAPNGVAMADDEPEQVLEVMENEWRANPYRIREKTGLEKGTVNSALVTLMREGEVRQVTRGLYEYIGENNNND